jgi:hypothetical protein
MQIPQASEISVARAGNGDLEGGARLRRPLPLRTGLWFAVLDRCAGSSSPRSWRDFKSPLPAAKFHGEPWRYCRKA